MQTIDYVVNVFSRLLPGRKTMGMALTSVHAPLASPWATTQLARVVLGDLFNRDPGIVTRADAMEIPVVVRGRDLICGTLAKHPLALFQRMPAGVDDVRLPTPAWLESTNTGQSPLLRMVWTLDDILFSSLSLWALERDHSGQVTDAIRVDPAEWTVDPDSRGVIVRGEPVTDPAAVCLFEGSRDPLLTLARKSIRASQNLATSWQKRVETPVPLLAIKQTDANAQLDDDEVKDMVLDFDAARRASGTIPVPYGYEVEAIGDVAPDLYVAGRNADRLDWANLLGLPAALLEGSQSTASLTYSTQEGRRNELVDYSLSYWAMAVEARLSQDDLTPAGTYVRFDLADTLDPDQPPTNPGSED